MLLPSGAAEARTGKQHRAGCYRPAAQTLYASSRRWVWAVLQPRAAVLQKGKRSIRVPDSDTDSESESPTDQQAGSCPAAP